MGAAERHEVLRGIGAALGYLEDVVGLQATRALARAGAEDHRLAAPAVALEDELARLAVGAAAAVGAADMLGAAGALRQVRAPRNGADVQEPNAAEVAVAWHAHKVCADGAAAHAVRSHAAVAAIARDRSLRCSLAVKRGQQPDPLDAA